MSSIPSVLIPYRTRSKAVPYEEAVRTAGLEPVAIEATVARPKLTGWSGLLLAGGTDVNPCRYGQEPRQETDAPDDARDEFEVALLREAAEKSLPVLAICRGLQILNVFHGGTLVQHLDPPRHDVESECKGDAAHQVEIDSASRLGSIAGTNRWQVNSRHHQAVEVLGKGLRISARSVEDKVVEGLELPGERFVVAVQWHPEDQVTNYPEQLKIFRGFAAAICECR